MSVSGSKCKCGVSGSDLGNVGTFLIKELNVYF